jgi:hypothetical protein
MDSQFRHLLGSTIHHIVPSALALCLVLAMNVAPASAQGFGDDVVGCAVDRPCFNNVYDAIGHKLVIEWSTTEPYGHFNFNWAHDGGPSHPQELDGNRRRFIIENVWENQRYNFTIQGCKEVLIGKDDCSPTESRSHTTGDFPRSGPTSAELRYGPDTCIDGYVWREAFTDDHVCVTPDVRSQAAYDNSQASARRQPGGGDWGPNTCRTGYVWRVARPSDLVCVTPEVRSQTEVDNSQEVNRRVRH